MQETPLAEGPVALRATAVTCVFPTTPSKTGDTALGGLLRTEDSKPILRVWTATKQNSCFIKLVL